MHTHKRFDEKLHCQTLSRAFSLSDMNHELLLRKTCPIDHVKKWSRISVDRLLLKTRFAIFGRVSRSKFITS